MTAPSPGALLLLRAAARVLARSEGPHHQLRGGGGAANLAPSLQLLRALAAAEPAGASSLARGHYTSLSSPSIPASSPQQQQQHTGRRSLASDAAAAAASAASAATDERPPPRQPQQQRRQRPQQQQQPRGGKPRRGNDDTDMLRGLPVFRAGGDGGGHNTNNQRRHGQRHGPPRPPSSNSSSPSLGWRRPPTPLQTDAQRAARACATPDQLRSHLAEPGVLEALTVPEVVTAAMRASEIMAGDLLLLPRPPPHQQQQQQGAPSPPPPQTPPPLAARVLELVPRMNSPQLSRVLYAFAQRTTTADRVPGLRDVLLPPLRESARLLAEGAPFAYPWAAGGRRRGGAGGAPAAAASSAAEEEEGGGGDGDGAAHPADAAAASDQQSQQQPQPPPPQPLSPHAACLVAWALGRLQLRDEPAAAHIAAAAAERIVPRLVGPQAFLLTTLAQGLSCAGRHQWSAFAAIAEASRPVVRDGRLTPGAMSMLARAMATARHADEPMYDAICRAATPLLMADAITYASMPPLPPPIGWAVPPEPGVAAAEALAASEVSAAASAASAAARAQSLEEEEGGEGQGEGVQAEEEDAVAAAGDEDPTTPTPTPTAASSLPRFRPNQLAQLLWALATVHHPLRPEFFAAAAAAGAAMAPRMSAAEIAEIAWACARRRAYAPSLYAALARRATELADAGAMMPRHATLVAWSAARQGHGDAALLRALARLMIRGGVGVDRPPAAAGMMPFNISNMAWAYGALGVVAEAAPGAAAAEAAAGGGGGKDGGGGGSSNNNSGGGGGGGGLSGGLLVVPEMPELLRRLARAALQVRFEDFKPQNLSDLAFGLSACGYGRGAFGGGGQGGGGQANGGTVPQEQEQEQEDPARARLIYGGIADAAVAQAAQLTNHSLADLCWAFAHAGAPAPQLFAHATAAAAQPGRMSGFSLGMAADLLWASAAAGHRDDALLDAAAALLPHRLEQLARDPEAGAKIRWALGRQPHAGLAGALDECERQNKKGAGAGSSGA